MNYAELEQAIKDYIETDEPSFVANIPNFVRSAEQKIINTVQLPATRRNSTANVIQNNPYLPLPTDFLASYSLALFDDDNRYEYLLEKDVNFIREAFPFPPVTGRPTYYALFGPATAGSPVPIITNELSIILGPTPDKTYTVELHYYAYPESIVTAGETWLGDNFETVLLYGALIEANMYVKGEQDMATLYQAQFNEALARLKRLADGKNRRDAYRSGQLRLDVQ
jgi:hypothetical protein